MYPQRNRQTSSKPWLRRHDLLNFINTLYDGDLHAKRVLSLANATLGVLTSASLAIHAVGRGLAQAMGTLTKHGVKQVDRLLTNQGVNVWTFFAYWTPYIVGARTEVVVALDWTSFAADEQETIVLSMLTGHGRATPLLWKTVASSTLKGNQRRYEYEVLCRLREVLPDGVKVTVVADRGFADCKRPVHEVQQESGGLHEGDYCDGSGGRIALDGSNCRGTNVLLTGDQLPGGAIRLHCCRRRHQWRRP